MLKEFLNKLERRLPIQETVSKFGQLFAAGSTGSLRFSEEGFSALCRFLENGDGSFQSLAIQAGVKWADGSQRVILRKLLLSRGFQTPSCLWAYRQLRGPQEDLFRDCPSPEMSFMQIILLKENDPSEAIPFLIERFILAESVSEELRSMARVCVLRLLDSGGSPELVRNLQSRFPKVEPLFHWRPSIPGSTLAKVNGKSSAPIDFHQMVRSIHDMREFSSLTRTIYLLSLFFIPLTEKSWASLLLSRTDRIFFDRLKRAGVAVSSDGGYMLSPDPTKKRSIRRFLYESYPLAKESVSKNREARTREERERKVRNRELDRQALAMVADGIICVDRSGLLYYLNPAAEAILNDSIDLRVRLFGTESIEEGLKNYSPDAVVARLTESFSEQENGSEVYGDRIRLSVAGKHIEAQLGQHVILLRDTTDQHLVEEEIRRLYRHEMRAALDVLEVGIQTSRDFLAAGDVDEAAKCMEQVEGKRQDLSDMLAERMDFIRLHSGSLKVRSDEVNLNLVVDKCVNNYRDSAFAKHVALTSDHLTVRGILVAGEQRFLVRALDNIIRNAIRFAPEGSEVKVSIGTVRKEAFVNVQDSGPGIPPENLGKIFQLGFTTGGSGRGLYLARRIITAHGGRIEVRSIPNNGSTFSLRLPALSED